MEPYSYGTKGIIKEIFNEKSLRKGKICTSTKLRHIK